MEDKTSRHKGTFVGVHLEDGQLEKLKLVEEKYDDFFGSKGRNRARALRWFIDSMPVEAIEGFPKGQASASMIA